MKYDFKTLVKRNNSGSFKWDEMYEENPNVGDDIVPFSVADMELKNAPEIMEGLRHFLNDDHIILGYTGPTKSFFDAVIGWMKRIHNWEIKEEWIFQTAGVIPGLYNLVNAFTKEKEGVIIMPPVYYPFKRCVSQTNRTLVEVPLINKDNYYYIDFDLLEEKAKEENTKLLILCSPHNPIGRVWRKEELEKLVKICSDNNVLIISDEIHNDLIMDGYNHTVLANLSQKAADNCIVCTAPSKTFNLAGLQCANIVIPNDTLRKQYEFYLTTVSFHTLNALAYKACELAYTKCDDWYNELLKHIKKNADFCKKFIEENMPEIKVYDLEGTYLQWWDCKKLGLEYKELEKFMKENALLFLDEGYIFGKEAEGFERINLACPKDVLEKALNRLYSAYLKLRG